MSVTINKGTDWTEEKNAALARLQIRCDRANATYLTISAGQTYVYTAKAREADQIIALNNAAVTGENYPFVAAQAAVDGTDVFSAALSIKLARDNANQWVGANFWIMNYCRSFIWTLPNSHFAIQILEDTIFFFGEPEDDEDD